MLEEIGCFALVLEKIPAELAKKVAESVSIPVIGIGAGGGVDGQVLVMHDMLGINKGFSPKFLRRYADLSTITMMLSATISTTSREATSPTARSSTNPHTHNIIYKPC